MSVAVPTSVLLLLFFTLLGRCCGLGDSVSCTVRRCEESGDSALAPKGWPSGLVGNLHCCVLLLLAKPSRDVKGSASPYLEDRTIQNCKQSHLVCMYLMGKQHLGVAALTVHTAHAIQHYRLVALHGQNHGQNSLLVMCECETCRASAFMLIYSAKGITMQSRRRILHVMGQTRPQTGLFVSKPDTRPRPF